MNSPQIWEKHIKKFTNYSSILQKNIIHKRYAYLRISNNEGVKNE